MRVAGTVYIYLLVEIGDEQHVGEAAQDGRVWRSEATVGGERKGSQIRQGTAVRTRQRWISET